MDIKLIAEIKRRGVPALYSQDNSSDPTVYLALSLLGFSWQWFVTECNIQTDGDILFFGYVSGFEKEWGYFNLAELERSRYTLLVDYKFKPVPFSELKKTYHL
jgi:hypothetical protein